MTSSEGPGEPRREGEAEQLTQLLAAVGSGKAAAEDLLPLVYHELRRVAAAKMAREAPGHTLQATALVHEAWLRLAGSGQSSWDNRNHFFAAAAEAMRRILVENARRKKQLKRGGEWARIDFEGLDLPGASVDDKVLLVHEALDALAKLDAVQAEVVKLHYFVGLNHEEAGQVLDLSERTVRRYWSFARVWLYQYISERFAQGSRG